MLFSTDYAAFVRRGDCGMRKKLVSVLLSISVLGALAIGTPTVAEELSDFPVRTPGNGTPVQTVWFPASDTSETTAETSTETTLQTPETTTPETTTPETVETPETSVTINRTVSVKSLSVETNEDGKVTLSWKKPSKKAKKALKKAKRIEVQYSTDKKFKKKVQTETIKKNSSEVVLENAKNNKTYYVRMRYVDADGNVSEWSDVQKIKT